ncbi:MBL fold metallo-hydrolase [Halarcobacter bivalviorum]|uniref:MBL fold metallohydrolase n=2 Tax=Halarcobacter bivalviorum TaxID=663364 RepID=A0AB33GG91_9BACT|nr:MBL fold metallo-hydrolase [Halarcobacter bivalviorum]AXH12368.1 MBL fold metallohydrolase [Halarcobacter bivalviorum]
MRKIISTMAILGLSTSVFAHDYKLEPKKINDNTWCFLGKLEAPTKNNGGFMSNHCYVNTGKNYVLIDAGATYELAKQAYEKMSEIKKLPVSTIILTHEHDDHWLGASFYKKEFNSKLIGSSLINKNYNENSKTRMFKMLSEDAIKNTSIIKVDEEIKEVKTLKVDEVEFQIIPIGRKAHSSDDLFVYVPSNKTLFASDVVMNGRITSNRDGSVIGQLKAVEMIEKMDYNNLIPGHGFDTSKNAINETKQYFTLLKQRVLEAVEEEVGAANITKHVKMEEFKDKALYEELNSRNVFDAYSELEFYEEE